MRPHKSRVPTSSDMRCRGLDTSEAFWQSNITPDGHFLASNGYTSLGHVNMASPFNSSWIQRLIPPQTTRMEQPQPSEKLSKDSCGIDGLRTNWNESADHFISWGNQCDIPFYENSRRSKHDFFGSRKTYLGSSPPVHARNGVNILPFEAPDALPPEIQVLPKSLPVVESLLPGCSKQARENKVSEETCMRHVLSRCTGFANPMQAVHYFADEKSRVSCSSIKALNSGSIVGAAGDLLALQSLQPVKRCIGPSQPCSEFSFSSNDAVTPNINTTYRGKDRQIDTNLRTYKSSTTTEDSLALLQKDSRRFVPSEGWASSLPTCQPIENRIFDEYSMPKNYCKLKKRSHAHDGSDVLHGREGSFDERWLSCPCKEKDELQQISNFPSQSGINNAKEKAGIYPSHQTIEQDLGSSHEEQGGMSRSFSFHFENRLAPEDYSQLLVRKGQWPFCPSTVSSQEFGQSRLSEDKRARGLAEARTLGVPYNNSSTFKEPVVRGAGTDCSGRCQFSPFFKSDYLNESSSCGVLDKHDISTYKVTCIDIGGVRKNHMKVEALPGKDVDHALQTPKGRHPLSRLEYNSMIKGLEANCSDGKCVSVNHWQVCDLPIRSSNYPCPHESTQLNNADGNTCSIGSCSKRPSIEVSTSVDERSQSIASEKPVSLHEQLHSSQREHVGTGLSTASDEQESAGKNATSWEASGSGTEKNVWMKRWSTLKTRKVQAVSRLDREGATLAGMTHAENYIKDHYTSQTSREFSGPYSLRPFKRICREERNGRPHPELGNAVFKNDSVAVGREDNDKAVASNFMKRFFTPSVAAMAIMGMTAQKVNGTQTQKSGLFGIWASNASQRKLPGAQAEVCKEFTTLSNCKKEISQSEAKAPPTSVDL